MDRMYEIATPVCAGEIVKRVPTVSIATARINIVPRKSIRIPSHRWSNISTDPAIISQRKAHLIGVGQPVSSIFNVHPISIFVIEAVLFPIGTNGSNP